MITPLVSFETVPLRFSTHWSEEIPDSRPALVRATRMGGLRVTAPMLSPPSMHTARFLVYEIPISQPSVPSRFFMASTPTLVRRDDGAAHGQRSELFKQVRFSGHDLRARAADRLHDTIGGIIGKLGERSGSLSPSPFCWVRPLSRLTLPLKSGSPRPVSAVVAGSTTSKPMASM